MSENLYTGTLNALSRLSEGARRMYMAAGMVARKPVPGRSMPDTSEPTDATLEAQIDAAEDVRLMRAHAGWKHFEAAFARLNEKTLDELRKLDPLTQAAQMVGQQQANKILGQLLSELGEVEANGQRARDLLAKRHPKPGG